MALFVVAAADEIVTTLRPSSPDCLTDGPLIENIEIEERTLFSARLNRKAAVDE